MKEKGGRSIGGRTESYFISIILLFVVLSIFSVPATGSSDFDDSLTVDFNDLKLFTYYWLYDYNDNRLCASWDLASSGLIDFYDLKAFVERWLLPYDFEDFSSFGRYWRKEVDYRFEDTRFDLTEDGFIDLRDFSALAVDWGSWINPCEDTNVSGPWRDIIFTGIGSCGGIDCILNGDDYSDFIWDNCGNYLFMVCTMTDEFGGYCAYNYYFNGQFIRNRVGLCIYNCGRNSFQVRKNASGSRILKTRHRTRNIPPYDTECLLHPEWCDSSICDQGARNKYDWQIVDYNCITEQKTAYCRESYTNPDTYGFWEPDQGDSSSCELPWW